MTRFFKGLGGFLLGVFLPAGDARREEPPGLGDDALPVARVEARAAPLDGGDGERRERRQALLFDQRETISSALPRPSVRRPSRVSSRRRPRTAFDGSRCATKRNDHAAADAASRRVIARTKSSSAEGLSAGLFRVIRRWSRRATRACMSSSRNLRIEPSEPRARVTRRPAPPPGRARRRLGSFDRRDSARARHTPRRKQSNAESQPGTRRRSRSRRRRRVETRVSGTTRARARDVAASSVRAFVRGRTVPPHGEASERGSRWRSPRARARAMTRSAGARAVGAERRQRSLHVRRENVASSARR